jgi:ElaA protein
MKTLSTRTLQFEQLSIYELHDILQLRSSVFVVEQDCVYQDMDGADFKSTHILGYAAGQFAAYSRILPPDEKDIVHIGRVLVAQKFRKQRLGRQIMDQSIKFCRSTYAKNPVVLAAQCYLKHFYESLGFKAISEDYLMDGIPHLDMRLSP